MNSFAFGLAAVFVIFIVLPQFPIWVTWIVNITLVWTLIGAWFVLPRFNKRYPGLPISARYKIAFFWPLYRHWLNTEGRDDE